MHSTVRTNTCSASSSAGGRVCGVTESSCSPEPMVNASRTTTHPDGVFHVVTSTFVPGSYAPRRRMVDAERRKLEEPRLAIQEAREHAGRVESRHAEPVDRPVRGHQCTGVAVGQECVVRDRGKRRPGGRALRGSFRSWRGGAHESTHALRRLWWRSTDAFATSGPRVPRTRSCARCRLEQCGCRPRTMLAAAGTHFSGCGSFDIAGTPILGRFAAGNDRMIRLRTDSPWRISRRRCPGVLRAAAQVDGTAVGCPRAPRKPVPHAPVASKVYARCGEALRGPSLG